MKPMARQDVTATTGRGPLHEHVVDTIGNTLGMQINNFAPEG